MLSQEGQREDEPVPAEDGAGRVWSQLDKGRVKKRLKI